VRHDLLEVLDPMSLVREIRPIFPSLFHQEENIVTALLGENEIHLHLARSVRVSGYQETQRVMLLEHDECHGKSLRPLGGSAIPADLSSASFPDLKPHLEDTPAVRSA
jgi:hypothetical protein